jgi:hypothetical protein
MLFIAKLASKDFVALLRLQTIATKVVLTSRCHSCPDTLKKCKAKMLVYEVKKDLKK